MTGKTHALAGAFVALALHGSGAEVVMATFGGLLPDIDTAQSIVGKHAKTFAKLLPHRGPTHSVLMLVFATFVNPWLGLGVLTHIVLDMMTAKGLKLFWPWDKKFRFPLAKKNVNQGTFEQVLQLAMLIASVVICIRSMSGFFSFDLLDEMDWFTSWYDTARDYAVARADDFIRIFS